MQVASEDNEDADHLGGKHADIEPERHQSAGGCECYLNDSHWSHDSEGTNTSTCNESANVEHRQAPVRKRLDKVADSVDGHVQAI